ncbi:MAG: hypothetical protein R3F55_09980 [Alphaproteobacteria bacterium]
MRNTGKTYRTLAILGLLAAASFGSACSHDVRIDAPDAPIEMSVTIHVQQEVHVRLADAAHPR